MFILFVRVSRLKNQQTMTTVHCRQTTRDGSVDSLDIKLAGREPADVFPYHTRVHSDMPPGSRDLSILKPAWPQVNAGKLTSVVSQ